MLPGKVLIITSSGSEGDERYAKMDERKRKRMMSNRESARRSRMRKEQHIKELNNQVSYLKSSNNVIVQEMNSVRQLWSGVESENMVLRAQLADLKNRLESLEIVLSYMRGTSTSTSTSTSGCSMAICQDDPLLKPLQVSCQSMPLMASYAGMFRF
ncbi:bZIP transcription factor 53-like [Cornus florida]|uniref:bZIP transcription factor 53-like n=1 Tax=Cornus florida TaxID=4283 RepID=UPI002899A25F|nr:bZIP transcription factor 53-like [Cornus florida]